MPAEPTPGPVVVIGAGTMGLGIAQNLLTAGAAVVLVDSVPAAAERARERVGVGLARHYRDHDDAERAAAECLDRLSVEVALAPVSPALVVEAVPEVAELKHAVLADADECYPGATVVASNTSSLSIAGLAGAMRDPARFVGMHFFNPVPRSSLIELVVGPDTAEATVAAAGAWVELLGKTAIVVRDSPGFATSRLGLALGLEAIRMVEQGVASPEDIDLGMTLGYKHPIGPLRLTDLVGLDVRLGIAEHLAATLGERFEPPALLRQMVAAGKLGQKSGEGFYRWP